MTIYDLLERRATLTELILEALKSVPERSDESQSGAAYRTPLWDFARILRAHPRLEGLPPRKAFTAICDAVRGFCNEGQEPWTDYLGFTEEDEYEFLTIWRKVKFPAGVDFLADAVSMADSEPLVFESHGDGKITTYERFVSIAGYLQVSLGPDVNILLPCEKIAEILNVDPSRVSQLRQLAVADGYLVEVVPYRPPQTGRGRSTEFSFCLDRFPELQSPASQQDEPEPVEVEDW
jgi:hypothetical protein